MAVNVIKIWLDPKKSTYAEATVNLQTFIIEYRALEYYRIQFSDKVSDPTACFQATDGITTIPGASEAYAPNPSLGMGVVRVYPQKVTDSPTLWDVQVEYSSRVPQGGSPQQKEKWDIQVDVGSEPITETVYHDIGGLPILNSACDTFEQQPTRDHHVEVITIAYKTLSLDVAAIEDCVGKLNQEAVNFNINGYTKAAEPMSLLLAPPRFHTVLSSDPTKTFWQVELEFRYLPPKQSPVQGAGMVSGWQTFILDQGYNEIGDEDWNEDLLVGITYTDKDGNEVPVNKPQLLNGHGIQLNPTSRSPCEPDSDSPKPVYLQFDLLDNADYTPILVSTVGSVG